MRTKLIILTLFSIALVYSCKREDVSDCEDCLNGSYCYNDTCRCLTGYEGTKCETKTTAKFLGNYTVSDSGSFSWTSCLSGPQYQTVAITRTHLSSIFEDAALGQVIITNYFGDGVATVAQVKGSELTITGDLKLTYGSGPTYTTDICFLNNKSFPTGLLATTNDSTGVDTTGTTILENVTRLTINMHGYCYTDLGSCGNEAKETICKSIFTKTE